MFGRKPKRERDPEEAIAPVQEDLGTEVNVNGAQESIVAPPSNLADVHMVAVATALKPELKLLYSSALALGVRMKVLGLGAPWRGRNERWSWNQR